MQMLRPNTQTMIDQWTQLSAEIGKASYDKNVKGQIVVIGSGLSFVDFTRDAEEELLSADAVFHCVYDKVTQTWIGQIRPDAYDLRILYGENIDRHLTYVRMAEAMLHFVRLGKKVVAVLYGHPGVFAMPAHRAVHIARSEGHQAKMRPGISALDYLVADIGFDPALPGLATFEATDMLLRKRRIDPTLHVVLWQVGVVGEFQFSPGGFENRGFEMLVARLKETYGPDWEVTHYIAPQYVGIEPLIERIPVARLLDETTRKAISSLSTFYIEPKVEVDTDRDISLQLGFIREGQEAPAPMRLYDYTRYAAREQFAVRGFTRFTPPPHYRLASYSPEYEFMLGLSRDIKLQAQYKVDPTRVVAASSLPLHSERSAKLLSIPHPRAIDAALNEASVVEG